MRYLLVDESHGQILHEFERLEDALNALNTLDEELSRTRDLSLVCLQESASDLVGSRSMMTISVLG